MAWKNKNENLWYRAGLAFECTQCGNCCSGPEEGYVWITDSEIEAAAAALNMTGDEFRNKYVRKVGKRMSLIEQANKDCIFLQPNDSGGKGCSIYSVRPSQCRTWPFWPMNLSSVDNWIAAQSRCPGINRGQLHELDEIIEARDNT